jgi:hypothetical protein
MKILVTVNRVIGFNIKPRVKPDARILYLIIGIAALFATAPVTASQQSASEETKAQGQSDFDKDEAAPQSEDIAAEDAEKESEPFPQMFYDEQVTAKGQRVLFHKIRIKDSPLLHSWLGKDECDLAKSWGSFAQNRYKTRKADFVTYVFGYERQVVIAPGGYVPENLETRFSCNMTFKVSDGIIQDYRFNGNYCGPTESSRLARGSN